MATAIRSPERARRNTYPALIATVAAALSLGGCAAQVADLGLGSPSAASAGQVAEAGASPTSDLEKATEYWGREAGKDPRNSAAVLNYARNLKALGRKQEALGTLQASYIYAAQNREYLSEYGRLALDLGQVSTAAALLERADDPGRPDWKLISARGTVLAKQGNYKDAIPYFERARALAPGQASVLNNLAMAYTMDGKAEKGETLLREAAQMRGGDPRVQQNLALVLNLQGKDGEAAAAATADGASAPPVAQAAPEAAVTRGPVTPAVETPVAPVKAAPAVARAAPVRATLAKAGGKKGAAETAPAAGAPIDPDAIIQAAIKAEMEKDKKSTAVSTGSVATR